MSLIKCLECGQDVSDQAPSCPHCGYVFRKEEIKESVVIKQVPSININRIEKTSKAAKLTKLISILTFVFGIIFSVIPNTIISNIGFVFVFLGIILFISYKLGNWWERG